MRRAIQERNTKETELNMIVEIDGSGQALVDTGIGFFNHMLELFAFHSGFDLKVKARGDLEVDDHHTVEDLGILFGKCLKEALKDKRGIARYGSFRMPMDEALAIVDLDISGRPYLVFDAEFTREKVGEYSTEMTEEFFRAICDHSGITLHIHVPYGKNDHHKIEAVFKAFGRALKQAVRIEGDAIPSSKGVLE
ncbi:imidazoleglycerol-phosphate dehydratase HisB [Ileibacterium valens]|uniref:Imidazoleglycerol-phosphate dehydratase n=1 Tax=Ileibacterium valens TaxID=1862668 RepID=A0A1U7ND90_9FIRM|nr:imidazoleglycerol-phosphate dehydratase HisB [Ileibacterium valens]OLU36934.1 imidazoleglycerol-phosphate dehydratase [Ileibacterium valens]OLU37246.1 imidazoleglycerol-phosphate dehydratase [Erysipelotrichaceae bacterium NYU-BL-F16]OLU38640.1 imidazoleglycerol-phosphate dehydratase [Erysipelotrichaceae bacterium NYU-BL-E8]